MSRAAKARELLLWCAPALVFGFVLRALLSTAMPFAYVQYDSHRLLFGAVDWLSPAHKAVFGDNVPFLFPWLCRLAQSGPIPAMTAIQLVQHALGLVQVALAGVLVRCWVPRWKWWIVPATLVFAAHPSFLWFEHTVMLETLYAFATVLLAVAGTWLLRRPSLAAAASVCAAMALAAFTRPEGKLFVAFGVLALVVAFWKSWRRLAIAAAMLAITLFGIKLGTVPGEGGVMLYSSVLHLSVEKSRAHPDAAPYVAELRAEAIAESSRGPAFVSRKQRKALFDALAKYLAEHPDATDAGAAARRVHRVAFALALETIARAPFALPTLAVHKFRESADDLVSGSFNEVWLHERQFERLRTGWFYIKQAGPQLYGQRFGSEQEMLDYAKSAFPPKRVRWFESLHKQWRRLYAWQMPDTRFASRKLAGLPWFYLLPLAGMIAAIMWPLPSRRFHVCWVLALAGVWFIVMLTANEYPRFRMGFEPFIFLYPFVAFDAAVALALRVRQRLSARTADPSAS